MNILAIDPGTEGAICLVDKSGLCSYFDELPYNKKGVDVRKLRDTIEMLSPEMIAVETQQARNGQGNQASIMINYGRILATADLCGVAIIEHQPQAWQRYHKVYGLGDGRAEKKKIHVAKAVALGFDVPYTSYKKDGTPYKRAKRHDGMADAYLLGVAAFVLPPF